MKSVTQTDTDVISPMGSWSRLPVFLLMAMVLIVAGLGSAMVAMRYAIRGQEVVVVDLTGMTQVEAADLLFDQGLGLDVLGGRFSLTVPEGEVLNQTPRAGVSVKRDRSVRILLSLGERQFPVPDVEGSSLRSAQMLLGQRGLSVGNTMYAHSAGGDPSTVVYQSPPAGDMGGADPSVNVLVSLGPIGDYYIMPDVTGQQVDAVTARMRSEGFRVGEIRNTRQAGTAPGRILGQEPTPGYKIAKTDIIRLEVSE
jgi:beta-lactam-binding protein with PASTA domain